MAVGLAKFKNMQIIQSNSENMKAKGVYKLTRAFIQTIEQQNLLNEINELREDGKDAISLIRKLNTICQTEVLEFNNLLPTVGRAMIMNNLTNTSPTNDMVVNYIALGTGSTAVANADTTLDTETYRNQVASKTNASNIGYVTGFFDATETSGTFKEAGIFSDATSATDSGILVSRVLLNAPTGIAKTVVQTLTLDWTLTLS